MTVRSAFFNEYCEHLNSGCRHHENGVVREFMTNLRISGKDTQKIVLPIREPERTFSFPDILVTSGQIRTESLGLGLNYLSGELSLILLLILAEILYYPKNKIPKYEVIIFLLFLTAGFIFGIYYPQALPDKILLIWRFLGLAVLSTVLYLEISDVLFLSVLFASVPTWGIAAAKKMDYFTVSPEYFPVADIFFFIGWIITIAVAFSVIYVLLIADEKYVFYRSKSMAQRLLKQHLKFATVIIGIISCYFVFKH